jgi:hypothetical protein
MLADMIAFRAALAAPRARDYFADRERAPAKIAAPAHRRLLAALLETIRGDSRKRTLGLEL